MRRAISFRKQIAVLALAAVCAIAPGFPVSAEPAAQEPVTEAQTGQESVTEVQTEQNPAADVQTGQEPATEVKTEQNPAAEQMLAEQDAIAAAAEVADRYEEIIAAVGETDQAELADVEDLSEYAAETRELYESLDPEQQTQLAESTASFENAVVSIDSLKGLLEQAESGEEITPPGSYRENSWRYMNGEPIEEALQTVEEERAEITGEETDGAVPTANVAMVRSGGTMQYMSLAKADAVQNVATASTEVHKGIDVSSWQGKIDWNAVKKSGIKFAILRCGRVFAGQTKWTPDSYWERNASECERLGIPYGAYVYSYAKNLDEVDNEANKIIQAVKGHKLSLPVFYDIEDDIQMAAAKKTPGILNQFAKRFTDKVSAAGYATGLYSSSSWLDDYCLSFAQNTKHYIWIARYNTSISGPNADDRFTFKGPFCAWQYSSSGTVPGISGGVDMNKWYGALKTSSVGVSAEPTVIDGTTYEINGDVITYAATGENLAGVNAVRILDQSSEYYSTTAIWYSRNGVIGAKYDGLAEDAFTGKWYYFTDGKMDRSFEGLAKGNRWYYVRNGTIDYDFVGIAKSPQNGQLYAVTNGVIENNTCGIAKYKADGKWYFTRNAAVDRKFTGFAKSLINGRWYFVRRGVLDWKFTGVAKSVANGKWYFARKGELDWGFTGLGKSASNGRWYFVRKGALDWKFTGVAKSVKDGKWYFARRGEVDWKFTGVAKSIANGKWYYVRRGKLNWNYTGLAKSVANGKWYYVRKGQLDWKYSGRVKYNKKWYRVKKGRVV